MATSRLKLYNDALTICGERHLASLTENREPRHLLDHVWNNDGVRACLERGQWKFAMRTAQIDYDPSITTDFGYQRAFAKPDDWVNTCAVCSDEYFRVPLSAYEDEAGYWYADLDTIYVRYISDHASYGGDLSLWPISFSKFAATYFAGEIILKITSDEKKQSAILGPRGLLARRLSEAKKSDAMDGPARFPAEGTWTSARGGRSIRERGRRGQLIG